MTSGGNSTPMRGLNVFIKYKTQRIYKRDIAGLGTLEISGGRYTGRVTEFNFSIGRYRGRVTEFHFGIGRCRGRVGKWPKPVIRLTASRLTAQP